MPNTEINNPSRTVRAVERARQDQPYFNSFFSANSQLSDPEDKSSTKLVEGDTLQAGDDLCQIREYPSSTVRNAERTGKSVPYFSVIFPNYVSKTLDILRDTLYYANDNLWIIWKNSIQNYRRYRAETRAHVRTDR